MFKVEVTDTFGGESNYSWVHRHEIKGEMSDLALVRRAKALEGWNGIRCRREDYGDMIVLRPQGMCMVMFIQWSES